MLFEKMQTRITLQQLTQTVNSESGELVDEVKLNSNVWAEIKQPKSGNTFSSVAGGEVGLALQSFVIRYRDGIDPVSWRVKDRDGYLWRIVDIPKKINRKQGLELVCQWTGKNEQL